jgi:hypothetical protein
VSRKTSQLQIRVRPDQKRQLKRLAADAAMDMSSWVLSQILPDEAERFQAMLARVTGPQWRFALAEVADFLAALPHGAFARAVRNAPRARLDESILNHVAGAIERAAHRRGQASPPWTADVPIADLPTFGSTLSSVRLHLLIRAPVAFRRRNVFVDASLDDRV